MLTAEQTVARIIRGYRKYQWEKTRERNEALDCRIGNRAMSVLLGVDRWSDEEWKRRENAPRTANKQPKQKKRRESSFWG